MVGHLVLESNVTSSVIFTIRTPYYSIILIENENQLVHPERKTNYSDLDLDLGIIHWTQCGFPTRYNKSSYSHLLWEVVSECRLKCQIFLSKKVNNSNSHPCSPYKIAIRITLNRHGRLITSDKFREQIWNSHSSHQPKPKQLTHSHVFVF